MKTYKCVKTPDLVGQSWTVPEMEAIQAHTMKSCQYCATMSNHDHKCFPIGNGFDCMGTFTFRVKWAQLLARFLWSSNGRGNHLRLHKIWFWSNWLNVQMCKRFRVISKQLRLSETNTKRKHHLCFSVSAWFETVRDCPIQSELCQQNVQTIELSQPETEVGQSWTTSEDEIKKKKYERNKPTSESWYLWSRVSN